MLRLVFAFVFVRWWVGEVEMQCGEWGLGAGFQLR